MRVLSGIQPTGEMHLGNYLGAFKQFAELQKKYEAFFMIADLHALTVIHDRKKLRKMVIQTKRAFLAFGLDPKKSTLFVQSEIPQHAELSWILSTIAHLGELERMTQFKDKYSLTKTTYDAKSRTTMITGTGGRERANAALFTYPVLMAADILLYRAKGVPIGEDQLQHLELARTLSRRFNKIYGSTFLEPQPILAGDVARVMSLQDPSKKMSKSLGEKHYVGIFESEKQIRDKFKRAVTDSQTIIKYDPDKKPGISNLLHIYAGIKDVTIKASEKHFRGKSYAELKNEVAGAVIDEIKPIQMRYRALKDKEIERAFSNGRKKAEHEAENMMQKIKKQIGLL